VIRPHKVFAGWTSIRPTAERPVRRPVRRRTIQADSRTAAFSAPIRPSADERLALIPVYLGKILVPKEHPGKSTPPTPPKKLLLHGSEDSAAAPALFVVPYRSPPSWAFIPTATRKALT